MNNEIESLKPLWNEGKQRAMPSAMQTELIIESANERRKSSLYTQWGNTAILAAVLAVLVVFFYGLFPFGETLSQVGVHIMAGGLVVRIGTEILSIIRFMQIDVADHTVKATQDSLRFYTFRKQVHGPVTITIVALYIAGFFMLSPEISRYMPLEWVLVLDIVWISGAVVLIRLIHQGIQQEMAGLWELIELRERME